LLRRLSVLRPRTASTKIVLVPCRCSLQGCGQGDRRLYSYACCCCRKACWQRKPGT
jgi:hypothetical protein